MNPISNRKYVIDLKAKKIPLPGRLLLYFTSSLLIAVPLIGFIADWVNGDLGVNSFVFLLLFAGVAFYFLRKALWFTYGREIIEIFDHKVTHTRDFYWFAWKTKTYHFKKCRWTFKQQPSDDKRAALRLYFDKKERFETLAKLDAANLKQLRHDLEYRNDFDFI